MTRLERLSAILIQLQGRRVITGAEIARRFGVSLRTAYRDIRALEGAGVPIGSEAGKGYFLVDGYSLPPVSFSISEAAALAAARRLIGSMLDETTRNQLDSAAEKVIAAISPALRDAILAFDGRMAAPAGPTALQHLDSILPAIHVNRVLTIRYASAENEPTTRDIEPLILCFYNMRCIVFAYCRHRRAYRSFRTDRILSLVVREESFDPALHASEMRKVKVALEARRPAV